MTCCIAAICNSYDDGDFIIAAADSALTYGNIVAEVMAAKFSMKNNWVLMTAGELAPLEVIVDEFCAALKDGDADSKNARQLLRNIYKAQFAEWSTDRWLAPYNMEMEQFLRTGRKKFGDERFEELTRSIENDAAAFSGEIILCGWPENKKNPSIYVANRDGVFPHNSSGFAAIGSGAELARNSLLLHQYMKANPLEYAIYYVAAAKFSAEADSNVGENTFMWIGYPDDHVQSGPPGWLLQPNQVQRLREIWERHGKPRQPDILNMNLGKELIPAGLLSSLSEHRKRRTN
ncbi:MAG: hypothetical protein NVS1B11_36050 [Terriglobales bacterium]